VSGRGGRRETRDFQARAGTSSAAAVRLEASEGSPELGFCGGDVAIGVGDSGDGAVPQRWPVGFGFEFFCSGF